MTTKLYRNVYYYNLWSTVLALIIGFVIVVVYLTNSPQNEDDSDLNGAGFGHPGTKAYPQNLPGFLG